MGGSCEGEGEAGRDREGEGEGECKGDGAMAPEKGHKCLFEPRLSLLLS